MDHAAPIWIRKRDGRLVPFDPDAIGRSLFAAAESLGRPDALLARELTDGVLHFLALETNGVPPTTIELAELVAKVVRELGQPAIAKRYAEHARYELEPPAEPPEATRRLAAWVAAGVAPADLTRRVAALALADFSLGEVYPRDLVAAHRDGLIVLTGLDAPLEMAGCVLGPGSRPTDPGQGLLET